MSDETKKPRNAPISLVLNGYEVDALEDYLHRRAHATLVASGLAEEGYRGEAQHLLSIYGENVAAGLVFAIKNLVQEGPLADAIAAPNIESYAAYRV